jgi:hypothetical protein
MRTAHRRPPLPVCHQDAPDPWSFGTHARCHGVAAEHPGWTGTTTYELLGPYPNQRQRGCVPAGRGPAGHLTPFQAPCVGFAVDWRAAAARPGASRRSGYWSGLRALRKRGFIDDHSDAVLLRTPDALCRLL